MNTSTYNLYICIYILVHIIGVLTLLPGPILFPRPNFFPSATLFPARPCTVGPKRTVAPPQVIWLRFLFHERHFVFESGGLDNNTGGLTDGAVLFAFEKTKNAKCKDISKGGLISTGALIWNRLINTMPNVCQHV